MSRISWVMGGLVAFMLVAVKMPDWLSSSRATTTSAASAVAVVDKASAPEAPKSPWSYSSGDDDISGKKWKTATTTSLNSYKFEFPYEGGTFGSLAVQHHPRFGNTILFSITKGQLLCHVSGCTVTVKFDDKKAFKVHGLEPSDHSSDAIFLMAYPRIVKELKTAKKMIIEATFYQQGILSFNFDVAGFDPAK